jgi:hypothetical protein
VSVSATSSALGMTVAGQFTVLYAYSPSLSFLIAGGLSIMNCVLLIIIHYATESPDATSKSTEASKKDFCSMGTVSYVHATKILLTRISLYLTRSAETIYSYPDQFT